MRIESKHNSELFKAESMEKWNRLWKDRIVNQYIFLVASIVFLFVAIILIKSGNQTGFIFLSISLFGLMVTINFLTHANKQKKEYLEKINRLSEQYQSSNVPFFWELTDDYILYQDYQMMLKLKWQAFSHYYIKYDSLFLVMKDTNDSPISINKSEVSDDEFNDLKSFIEEKIMSNNKIN